MDVLCGKEEYRSERLNEGSGPGPVATRYRDSLFVTQLECRAIRRVSGELGTYTA